MVPNMTGVFSGGIVYEYFEETNDYGLVSAIDDNSVSTLADFAPFSSQIHAVTPTIVTAAAYTPTNTAAQACPTVDSTWLVAASGLPPTPNEAVCDCMVSTLECTAVSSIADTEIGTLFSQVCGYNSGKPCIGIVKNTTIWRLRSLFHVQLHTTTLIRFQCLLQRRGQLPSM